MKLFLLENNALQSIAIDEFQREKEVQTLVENNLMELFKLQFIETEYALKRYRLDTVAFNEDTNAFIVIEYKHGKNESLVDQGYAYLSTLLEYKADLVLLYNKRFNASKQVSDFSWSDSRIYFVSSKYTKYQISATSFADMPFNLFEIRRFKTGIIHVEEINKNDKISTKELKTPLNESVKEVVKEIIVYTESDHLANKSDSIIGMYEEFKSRVLDLDDISVEAKKLYISFMYESAVCQVIIQNAQLKVFLNSKYLNNAHFSNQGKLRDVSNVGHWGSLNTEYIIKDFDELDDAVFYVKKIVSAIKEKV